jgi:hypothetical protein
MKTFIISCAIVLISSSLALAQATAPAPVDLSYHFKAGTVLHYQRLDEMRNPDNPPGYSEGNWDLKEEIHFTVEKVDPDGDATLLVRVEETPDFKNGGDEDQTTGVGVTLGLDIPLYRVTVDRFGKYLNGEILHRTASDSMYNEKMKDPNWNGWKRPDSSLIKLNLSEEFCPRPAHAATHVGVAWEDSSSQISNSTHYYYNHSASPSTEPPPDGPSYYSQHYDYNILQDGTDRNAGQYHLSAKSMNYQVSEGTLMSQWTDDDNQLVRSPDGLTTMRTQFEKRVGGMGVDKSFTKRTLSLISVDSTAH